MTIIDYIWSRTLDSHLDNIPFYALVMLAMRRADSDNMAALEQAFPEIARDLRDRYNAPAGMLESDPFTPNEVVSMVQRVQDHARAIFQGQESKL